VARRYPIGAELAEGGVHFRVWAPAAQRLAVVLEDRREVALEPEHGGYFAGHIAGIGAGAHYRFRLDDRPEVHADPASRFQPDGPFGPSQVIDPGDAAWTDSTWHGIADPGTQVIYELHVGTFTCAGTWGAAAEQLPFLADLGITTIEMMPVNDYAGRHGWGYDGVNLFAPCRNYGTPGELRAFIDRAHALGVAVILDVVYNHFGPAGNPHFVYAPQFRAKDANEWGDALDYAVPGVREFFLTNAAYWIDEFHFDGLRIDATQAIHDRSAPHILTDLVRRARAAAGTRRIFIVGENEPQDTRVITDHGFDAVWNDDFHHAARVALTGATDGYFHDYRGTPQELVSAIKRGYLYQGQLYAWQRNTRGTPTHGLPASAFVHYLANHDQVANLGVGDRLTAIASPALLRAMTALLLLGPEIPMLFQGQETGTRTPWRFFCDHDPELSKLVREGRAGFLRQFARLATPETQAALPDPAAGSTFEACILDSAERTPDNPWVRLHRDLIALRRQVSSRDLDGAVLGPETFCIRWWAPDHLLLVNLGRTFREAVLPEPLLAPPAKTGWKLRWSSEHPDYGGLGTPVPFTTTRLAIPAYSAVLCVPDPDAQLRIDPPPVSGEKAPVEP
jgi:maltooligosyltrehalose trehalohydrolase